MPVRSESIALIVEDNNVNRLVAVQMLKRAGIVADEATGGEEALEMLRARRYDLVLMDVQMPGIDGLDTTRAIRCGDAGEINRRVPVVAMTAYASSDDEAACYAAGMSMYLSKPLSLQRFIDTVQEAVAMGHADPIAQKTTVDQAVEETEAGGDYDQVVARRAAGGDASAADRLVLAFVESLEEELPRLQKEAAGGQLQGVAIIARALWTTAVQAGATRLRRVLRRIETAAMSGDRTSAEEAVSELPAGLATFRAIIGRSRQ